MTDNTERVTIIEDDYFMNTDVSTLVEGDYYLFYLTNDKVYIFKDGVIGVSGIDLQQEEYYCRVPYTSGTLQEFVDNLTNL